MTETVGIERARFFPSGGHLGNLHRPEVQAEVMEALVDLRPVPMALDVDPPRPPVVRRARTRAECSNVLARAHSRHRIPRQERPVGACQDNRGV